jgi:uncharacterized membrane protein
MNERSMKPWLLGSLVLNLFLLGGIAGGAWHWWLAHGTVSVVAPPHGLRFAGDELSAEQQRIYRQGLRDARRGAAAQIQAAREGRAQVLSLLAARSFDRAALAAALARTREADAAVRTGYETSVINFAATLTPEERQQLSIGLARRTAFGPPASAASKP